MDVNRFQKIIEIVKYGFVIPSPKGGENEDDFIGRCMGNPTMNTEFPEQDQRYAVCKSKWEDK